jgi:glycosyltransferase involved in cell wall biosynthesis
MILFLRTSEINIDSRLLRYANALEQAGIEHAAAYWDRGERVGQAPFIPSFRWIRHLNYQSRLATALCLVRVNLYFILTLWRKRREIAMVHAVDLDTAITAWLMKRVTGLPYVYDIYDHYADSRGLGKTARAWLDRIEKSVIAHAECTILADKARRAQHAPIREERLLIIENVPRVSLALLRQSPPKNKTGRLKIGYLGTLEPRHRGLEDLISVVESNSRLDLAIVGSGALDSFCAAAAARCSRISKYPALPHEQGLTIMRDCDIMAGLYYTSQPNHRFAAPNKYFEHLLLGMPLLTSKGTPPGVKVPEHDTGWAIDDSCEAIAATLAQALADRELVERKGRNAAQLWQERYADYFEQTLRKNYIRIARQCSRSAVAEITAVDLAH